MNKVYPSCLLLITTLFGCVSFTIIYYPRFPDIY
ncbi:hypothetical protein UVUMRFZT_CDS0009 [Staphylococcus phage LJLAME001]